MLLQLLDGEPQWDIQALSIAVDVRGEMIYWISATDNVCFVFLKAVFKELMTSTYTGMERKLVIIVWFGFETRFWINECPSNFLGSID